VRIDARASSTRRWLRLWSEAMKVDVVLVNADEKDMATAGCQAGAPRL